MHFISQFTKVYLKKPSILHMSRVSLLWTSASSTETLRHDVHCACSMRSGRHVGSTLDSGWDFLTPYVFPTKYLFSHAVGVRQPCAIGAVIGRGNDELQCRPVPAESAGGFRADPADRKRHIRRCVQGKTAVRDAAAGFPLSDAEIRGCPLLPASVATTVEKKKTHYVATDC